MASMNEAQKHEALPRDQFLQNIEGAEERLAESPKPKIQRVPFMLRDHKHFVKYYEPRAVALGPLHHGKENCMLAEKFKPALAARFIKDSGCQPEDLLKIIEDNINILRDCYDEESTKSYDDEALAQLFFLDGCSTLQFIYSLMHGESANFKIKRDQVAFAEQDLFLLENQLPYQVLTLLMSSSKKHEELKIAIEDFVQKHIMAKEKKKSTGQTAPVHAKDRHGLEPTHGNREEEIDRQDTARYMGNTEEEIEPTHLLELLRTKMLGHPQKHIMAGKKKTTKGDTHTSPVHHKNTQQPGGTAINMENTEEEPQQPGGTAINMENTEEEPTHLLKLLWTKLLCRPQKSNAKEKKVKDRRQSFRNIQELKAAGIHFRPGKKSSLGDISFTSLGFVGFLSLPPISVDDSMGPKFSNLIAYEMCPDFQNDFGVSSYIGFLDSLIDHADDVKELRKAGVLHNFLGSDEEVAQLFNEIGTDLVPNSDTYRTVKAKIEKHYKSKCKTWMAQFCHEHFSSPWTILAFIGVLAALGLSGIQTWYTVNSPPSPCDSVCQYLKEQLNIQ